MATLDSLPDENTPLLSTPPSSDTISSVPEPSHPSSESRTCSYIYQAGSPRMIIAIVLASLFWLEFGGYLMVVPGLRIYEDIICHHYYDRFQGEEHIVLEGNIDEGMCKGVAIQNELSIIIAGSYFLGAIPSLVMTMPYGMLMDRIGRKPVLILAMTGIVIDALWKLVVIWFWRTLPLRLVWLSPIFTLIGGGSSVGSMVLFAITSEITSEEKRTNIFFLSAATDLIAQLIAPSVAALLMAKSPWIPYVLGTFFLTFGCLLNLFIPETLHMHPQTTSSSHLTPSPDNNDFSSSPKPQSSLFTTIKYQFSTSLQALRSSILILHSAPLILLLVTFIIQPFNSQSVDISFRYISNRFQFPLRFSSFLWSLRAAVQLILFLLLLPSLSHVMTTRFHIPPSKKDLYLARASILILTLGSILIAASPTLPLAIFGMAVFTLGTGYIALTRSLITTLVDKQHIGQLYAAVAVIETIGKLMAGPVFAQLYIVGLRMKGGWVGLPFFGLGVISGLAGIGVWSAGWVMSKKGWEWKNDIGG